MRVTYLAKTLQRVIGLPPYILKVSGRPLCKAGRSVVAEIAYKSLGGLGSFGRAVVVPHALALGLDSDTEVGTSTVYGSDASDPRVFFEQRCSQGNDPVCLMTNSNSGGSDVMDVTGVVLVLSGLILTLLFLVAFVLHAGARGPSVVDAVRVVDGGLLALVTFFSLHDAFF
jgi:hypothetical protein